MQKRKREKAKVKVIERMECKFYTCLFCGSIVIPAFHFEDNFYFEWHKQFMKEIELETLVSEEVILER